MAHDLDDEVETKVAEALDAVMRRAVAMYSTQSVETERRDDGSMESTLILDVNTEAIIAKVRADWREALDTLGAETASDERGEA